MSVELFGELLSSIDRAEISKNMPQGQVGKSKRAFVSELSDLAAERCWEKLLREDLRLGLPERPCCREVMLREDLRLGPRERPCCREVMLREDLRLSLPEGPCCREAMLRAVGGDAPSFPALPANESSCQFGETRFGKVFDFFSIWLRIPLPP